MCQVQPASFAQTTMSSAHDTSITRFSPNGRLFQVEYATLAVESGSAAVKMKSAFCLVGIRGKDIVVLAVEKKSTTKLQDSSEIEKMFKLDKHLLATFAGLNADARVLIAKARMECQSFKLTVEDPVSVEYITRYIAEIQQKYTQSSGVRPFGTAAIVIGFDIDKSPRMYKTEPSGKFAAWKATSTGRNNKDTIEWLENNYPLEDGTEPPSGDAAIHMAVSALLEVVDPRSRVIEVAYIKQDDPSNPVILQHKDLSSIIEKVQAEREAKKSKDNPKPSTSEEPTD